MQDVRVRAWGTIWAPFWWAVASFSALVVMLSFSDTVPREYPAFVELVASGGAQLESLVPIHLSDSEFLQTHIDEIGHAVIWGCGTLAFGLVLRRAELVLSMALVLFGSSVAIEFVQEVVTVSRGLERGDILANAFGIGTAATLLLVPTIVAYMVEQARFELVRSRPID